MLRWRRDLKRTENEERGKENGTGRKGTHLGKESIAGFLTQDEEWQERQRNTGL